MRRFNAWMLTAVVCLVMAGCGRGDREAAAVKVAQEDGAAAEKDAATGVKHKPPIIIDGHDAKPLPLRLAKRERSKPTQTIAVSAEAFDQEVRKDAVAAAKKFEPACIEVSGVVRNVGSRDKETFVTLEADVASLGVQCLFADEKQPWAKISKGQRVKLRGLWPEVMLQPQLVECEIVELGPSPALEITAETLAEEFVKDRDAARKKYADRPLIVTGFLVDAKANDLGAIRVFFKGAGNTRVDCGFDADNRADAEKLPLGQALRLVGEFSMIESAEMPALRGCRIVQLK